MNNLEILSKSQSNLIISRLAFEIFENNYLETELVLAGIYDKGYLLAKQLEQELKKIKPTLSIIFVKINLDKFAPTQSEILIDTDINEIKGKSVILVDDVLNSGRTLAYSLKPFLSVEIKRIQIAVLVDRGHKSFPVSADFVGYTLSTTLKEHIEVIFEDNAVEKVELR